jgi:hypothetical protein
MLLEASASLRIKEFACSSRFRSQGKPYRTGGPWPAQEEMHRALYLHRHAGGVHRWIKDLKVASVLAKTSAQYSLGARSSVCRGLLRGRMLDSRGVCPLAGCAEHHVSSVNVEGALNCHKQQ